MADSQQIILYHPTTPIVNLEALSRGRGCKYLLCLVGHTGNYIASQWKRKPVTVPAGHVLICLDEAAFNAAAPPANKSNDDGVEDFGAGYRFGHPLAIFSPR